MRRLPQFLRIGGLKVGVLRQPELVYDSGHDAHRAYGVFDPNKLIIWVDGDNGPERMKLTVAHEAVHVFINLARLELDPEDEEKLVGRMAPLLLDFIRANRGAITYLQES